MSPNRRPTAIPSCSRRPRSIRRRSCSTPDLPFDPDKDLKPVMLAAVTPNVLMATTKLPIHTLKDLVEAAGKEPGQLTYASQGIGSTAHLTVAYLMLLADIQMRHVLYRGAAPALTDVI